MTSKEPPLSMTLPSQIMSVVSLFILLLFSGPAVLGWFSGIHVVAVGTVVVLFGVVGLMLSNRLHSHRNSVRYGTLLWSAIVCGITACNLYTTKVSDPWFFPQLWIEGTLFLGAALVVGGTLSSAPEGSRNVATGGAKRNPWTVV